LNILRLFRRNLPAGYPAFRRPARQLSPDEPDDPLEAVDALVPAELDEVD
jgi:hypothetical protein